MDIKFINFSRPSVVVWGSFVCTWIVYLAGLAVYRLYLSPLAKFPGPKLAGLTRWYEIYYEVVLKGQFIFEIQRMHKKYGPIVRITPFELHVEDSDYWDELYSRSNRYDKYEWTFGRVKADHMFNTAKSDLHAIRRAPLSHMFSKRSIANFEPVIKSKIDLMYEGHDCLGNLAMQFPQTHSILNVVPDYITGMFYPGLQMLLVIQKDLNVKIAKLISGDDGSHTKSRAKTTMNELLQSSLPPQEKSPKRLRDDALLMMGAGTETTAWALTTACYHPIANPPILKKLRAELQEAMPNSAVLLDVFHLEKLPYLNACIQEGIRLSYGVSARNPRISPDKPMRYKDWEIPAGTPVSMTIVDVHHDERIFPNSRSYIPERWLHDPKTEDGANLSRYIVSFGKGERWCLGINLAYAELHLALAMVMRRFTFELYDTDITDIELAHDFFIPLPKLSSKGLRVKVASYTSM